MNEVIIASGRTDDEGAILATKLAVTTVAVWGEFPATGVRTSVTRAAGAVQFFNRCPWELVVPAGTLVATPSGIRFVTQGEATVPPTFAGRAGVAEVPVAAVEPGATGNVRGGDITIPLVDPLAWLASVSNPAPTQGGGCTETRFVTAEDYDTAIAALTRRFWVELERGHLGGISVTEEQRRRLANAMVDDAVAEPSRATVVGGTVDSFELSLRVAPTVRAVDEASPSWIHDLPPRPGALQPGLVSEPIALPSAATSRHSLGRASARRRELWRDTSIALVLLGAALLVGGIAQSTAPRGAVLGLMATPYASWTPSEPVRTPTATLPSAAPQGLQSEVTATPSPIAPSTPAAAPAPSPTRGPSPRPTPGASLSSARSARPTPAGPCGSAGCVVYVVRSGDTLGRVARRFGVSIQAILTANPQLWDPNLIVTGQALKIPSATS
jgi:hypothetical protein